MRTYEGISLALQLVHSALVVSGFGLKSVMVAAVDVMSKRAYSGMFRKRLEVLFDVEIETEPTSLTGWGSRH